MIRCDWCQSYNCRDTGGVEWTGHAIYVCLECSHEWVELSKVKHKFPDFTPLIKKLSEDLKKKKSGG